MWLPTFRRSGFAIPSDCTSLMRAGKLYLTVQDALALAIENNLNLEVDRYGPLLAQSALERAKAGGPVRGVPSASAQVSSVNSGVGVNGSAAERRAWPVERRRQRWKRAGNAARFNRWARLRRTWTRFCKTPLPLRT